MHYQGCLLVLTALLAFIRADSSPDRGSSARIVGGTPAKDWPWVASIRIVTPDYQTITCTGSLIAPNWILTAAHCTHEVTYATVFLGNNEFVETADPVNIFSHPCYNKSHISIHDIALIRLTREPDLKRNTIGLVCLPQEDVMQREEPYKNCYAVGWGQTETGNFSNTSLETKLNILGKEHCLGLMSQHCLDPKLLICAKSSRMGYGTCIGDSGGPLSCQQNDGLWVASGIVRSGYMCGDTMVANEYTNVFPYMAWIRETQAKMNHEPYACFNRNKDICKTATHRIHGVLSETDKFCKNIPAFSITEMLKEGKTGNLFVAFEGDMFFEAEDPQEKPYPLSTLWLRKGWSEFKGKRKLMPQDVYTSEKGFFFKNKLYVGFSQLWLGCPQSLCTASQVNAVFFMDGHVCVNVRGHLWQLPYNLISNRQPTVYPLRPNIVLSLPSNILLVIKDLHYVVAEREDELNVGFIRGLEPFNPFPSDFPLGLDAIVHRYSKDCDSLLYAFKGSSYWKLSYKMQEKIDGQYDYNKPIVTIFMDKRYPRPVRKLNSQLVDIDEAFIHPTLNQLLLFKKWFFAKIYLNPEKSFEDNMRANHRMEWRYIHTDLFGCEDRLYRHMQFASFADFRKKLISEKAFLKSVTSQSFFILITILSIVFLLMVVSYFVFGFYKRPKNKFKYKPLKMKVV